MTNPLGDNDLHRQLGGSPTEVAGLLDSTDGDVQSLALRELIARKERALPALLAVLKDGSEQTRSLAAEGLATLASPSTADTLARLVKDANEKVRSYAARGLASMDDPRAISALIATLADFEDVLHTPYTLSTYALARMGPRALAAVLPLLLARDKATRMRAHFIVRRIMEESGMLSDQPQLKALFEQYDPNDAASARKAAADKMTSWLRDHPLGGANASKQSNADVPDVSGF